MSTIHLVRHGQASFGAQDYDVLSELGRRQAEHVGTQLRHRQLTAGLVCSGALTRQRDTARLCAKAAGYGGEFEVDPRWNEYDHLAILAAYPPDSALSADDPAPLVASVRAWIDDGAGGRCAESWPAFRGRVSAALTELLDRDPDGGALVVTSGGVISAVCADLLGLDADGFLALNLAAVNTGITTVVRGRYGTRLSSFNEHVHLSGEYRDLLTYL